MSLIRVLQTSVAITVFLGLSSGSFTPHPSWAMSSAEEAPNVVTLPVPITAVVQLSAGENHTCIVTTEGGAKCWGRNNSGQLGDDSFENRMNPTDVVGLTSGVAAIAAGPSHTCAITTEGAAKCWGNNAYGQLGIDSMEPHRTPVDVIGLSSGVAAIDVGAIHSCALVNGIAKCWGGDFSSQLGNGAEGSTQIPVDVVGLGSGVKAISNGGYHTCAVTSGGAAKCWGDNSKGQVGDNSMDVRATPVTVAGLDSGVVNITAGYSSSCALLESGAVKCWGNNENGQLGNNSIFPVFLTPVDPLGLSTGILSFDAGPFSYHICAMSGVGGIKCWGKNSNGQIGDGSIGASAESLKPTDVSGISNGAIAIATGSTHSCAVMNNGTVKCWGNNEYGQLGNGLTLSHAYPGDVLISATCYKLTVSHSGDGVDPAPTLSQSQGCPPNHYLAGTVIALVSAPAADHYVQSWSGTNSDQSRDSANLVTMPAADHTASVTYDVCRTLTRNHTGEGANPVAVPSQSTGCAPDKYAAGDILSLVATPDDGQRVQSWTGATQTPASGDLVNTLTMPNANATVSVAYEPCVTLTATIEGEGELLQASPTATFGCDPSSYIAGQTVTLLAAPAAGWHVGGWSGTANNNSKSVTNSVVMGAGNATVGVIYQEGDLPLFLPSVAR